MKTIAIWGGTGLIGRKLVEKLSNDYSIVIVSRNPEKAKAIFGGKVLVCAGPPEKTPDIIINLAGENIGKKLWTKSQKDKIRSSRTTATRNVVNYINSLEQPPQLLVQASAIAYYGTSQTQVFKEGSPKGRSFLAEVTAQWESETDGLRNDVRKVIIRSGVVLTTAGGMLKEIILPFRLFAGGHTGNGKQPVSWIHIEDEAGTIKFIIENDNLNGVFNLTAPNSVTYREFAKTLAHAMGRPSWFHVPAFLVKLFFGEMGKEILLNGQSVYPARLLEHGYRFKYPQLGAALKNLLG